MLLLKIGYQTIQFLFPAQSSFTESFQVLTPTPLYIVSSQLGKTATLSPHPLHNLPILNVLNLLCCSSRSVIKLFNSSSLPSDFYQELSDLHSYLALHCLWPAWQGRATLSPHPLPKPQILNVLNLLCCSSRWVKKLFNSSSLPCDLLLRAFRSSLLPLFTLSCTSLSRQSYSLTPPPTQSPNPQCSQHTMLFFKVIYKTIQFLFPAQWSFTESFQVLTLPLSTLSLPTLARQLLSHPTPYPISQSSMFETYYVVLQGQL